MNRNQRRLKLIVHRIDQARADEELLELFYEYELYSSGFALLLTKLRNGSWLRNFLTDRLTNWYLGKATKKIASYKLMKARIDEATKKKS